AWPAGGAPVFAQSALRLDYTGVYVSGPYHRSAKPRRERTAAARGSVATLTGSRRAPLRNGRRVHAGGDRRGRGGPAGGWHPDRLGARVWWANRWSRPQPARPARKRRAAPRNGSARERWPPASW